MALTRGTHTVPMQIWPPKSNFVNKCSRSVSETRDDWKRWAKAQYGYAMCPLDNHWTTILAECWSVVYLKVFCFFFPTDIRPDQPDDVCTKCNCALVMPAAIWVQVSGWLDVLQCGSGQLSVNPPNRTRCIMWNTQTSEWSCDAHCSSSGKTMGPVCLLLIALL